LDRTVVLVRDELELSRSPGDDEDVRSLPLRLGGQEAMMSFVREPGG